MGDASGDDDDAFVYDPENPRELIGYAVRLFEATTATSADGGAGAGASP